MSHAQAKYLERFRFAHMPYHPMNEGKIERYHRSMKIVVKLETFYFLLDLEPAISDFGAYTNRERYHESLSNLAPDDVDFVIANGVKDKC